MNQCQKIQLERIKLGSFNNFDGETVALDLEKHEKLYKAFVFGRFGYSPLIELRDLAEDYINADTIMFLTSSDRLKALLKVIRKWHPDELGWTEAVAKETHYPEYKHMGMAPFPTEQELCMALGATLEAGQVLIRAWWD